MDLEESERPECSTAPAFAAERIRSFVDSLGAIDR